MRSISAKMYFEHIKNRNEAMNPLEIKRMRFVYNSQPFMLERYTNVQGAPVILKVETKNQTVDLPPFIPIIQEITNDRSYSSAHLSKRNHI